MKKINKWLVLSIILFILLILQRKCSTWNINKLEDKISLSELKYQKLDSVKNSLGEKIYKQEVIQVKTQVELKALSDSLLHLLKRDRKGDVVSVFKENTKTEIKDIYVPYDDPYMEPEDSTPIGEDVYDSLNTFKTRYLSLLSITKDSMIRVPLNASLVNKDYSVSLTAEKEGIKINNLKLNDSLIVIFKEGKRKFPWLKPRSIEVFFKHSNPFVSTTSSNSIIYKPKRKRLIINALLISAGIIIGRKL